MFAADGTVPGGDVNVKLLGFFREDGVLNAGVGLEEGLGLIRRGEGGSKGCGRFEVTRFFGVGVLNKVKVDDFRVDVFKSLSESFYSIGEGFGIFGFPEEEKAIG